MSTQIMYVRVLAERPLGIVPGTYVVGEQRDAGPGSVSVDKATGLAKTVGTADVLVVRDVPKNRDPDEPATTEATLLRASQPLSPRDAAHTLREWKASLDDRDAWRNAALQVLNTAIRGLRVTLRDPYAIEVTDADLLRTSFGHVTPEDAFRNADGASFREGPAAARKVTRTELLRRGEAVGLALRGATAILEGEELLALAAREVEHGRARSAAAALRAGVALLEEELGGAAPRVLTHRPSADLSDPAVLLEAVATVQDDLDRWRVQVESPELQAERVRAAVSADAR